MAEYAFNPATGQGEAVGSSAEAAPTSAQEQANLRQDIAFRNTAQHLTERAAQRNGTDVTQVGGGSVDAEIRLQTTQKELADMSSGRIPYNALRQLQLESQCNTLAQYLINGQTPPTEDGVAPTPPVVEETNQEEEDKRIDSLNELRDDLRNNDVLTKALEWGTDTLDDSVINALQLGLNSDDPNKLKYSANQIETLYKNREHVQTVESHEDVGVVSDSALQWFESNYDAETAKNVSLINHGIRSGKLSMGKATQQCLELGILPAMIAASKELPDFNIANF